jgi:dTDP-4-amino-4,6-dideoxygalactose transaminase
VVEPILRYGAQVKFYEISKKLQPDLADIESQIDERTRALLAIHYFGFPQRIGALRSLCKNHGIFLIEDCAHVLVGKSAEGEPLGSYGDISIFSWRKFLPLYDGGQLVINNRNLRADIRLEKEGHVFQLKVAKNILDKLIDDSENIVIKRMAGVSRWPSLLARRLACKNGHTPIAFNVNSYDLDFDLASANFGMTSLSRYILRNIDIDEVVVRRRENYLSLLDSVRTLPRVAPFYSELPSDVCPWVFPLLVDDIKDFQLILREKGIPAFTWSGVVHPDLPLDRFPTSKLFYTNLIFLPLHQSIGEPELNMMARTLTEELNKQA